jgi:hypothetical protein
MGNRKQFLNTGVVDPHLRELLERARNHEVTEDELHEQRISFAYGNALREEKITKDSVRVASKHIRLSGDH